MANHPTKKLIVTKKRALIKKNVKLKKITIIKKAKSLQKRKKKILVNKKAKFKKITLLKKRKKGLRLWVNKALLEKRAEQRRRRHRKRRKEKERSRREEASLQLVSGDTVTIPIEHTIERVETVEIVETVKAAETQPIDYVSGELYNPIFSFSIESPIQVDSQLWDSIGENLPDKYMIPDPEFLEAVCIEDLPTEISSQPALSKPIEVPFAIFIEPEPESQSPLTKEDAAESE